MHARIEGFCQNGNCHSASVVEESMLNEIDVALHALSPFGARQLICTTLAIRPAARKQEERKDVGSGRL